MIRTLEKIIILQNYLAKIWQIVLVIGFSCKEKKITLVTLNRKGIHRILNSLYNHQEGWKTRLIE